MSSILKVDTIQTTAGAAPTANGLGITPASGSVIQLRKAESSTVLNLSASSSYTNALTHTITPSSTSSKIKVYATMIYHTPHNNSVNHKFRIKRNGATTSHGWTQGSEAHYIQYRDAGINNAIPVPFNYTILDEPNTTSQITYTLDVQPTSGGLYLYNGRQIFLEEIAG